VRKPVEVAACPAASAGMVETARSRCKALLLLTAGLVDLEHSNSLVAAGSRAALLAARRTVTYLFYVADTMQFACGCVQSCSCGSCGVLQGLGVV